MMDEISYRDPKYNKDGTIDCEIEHPQFGWIPFTASSDDSEERGRALYAVLSQGEVAPYVEAM